MKKFKGTKGKWSPMTDAMCKNEYNSNVLPIKSLFGNYHQETHFCVCYGENTQEVQANALIISKSPEMLEMLQEAYNFIDDSGVQSGVNDILYKIKQLIKQATEL